MTRVKTNGFSGGVSDCASMQSNWLSLLANKMLRLLRNTLLNNKVPDQLVICAVQSGSSHFVSDVKAIF